MRSPSATGFDGASDGLITTFALVSSVTGADLGSSVAIVLGLANLLPDGISMGAGQYLARRSETQAAARADGKEVDRWVPAVHGTVMFAAFLILGAPPLLPYLVSIRQRRSRPRRSARQRSSSPSASASARCERPSRARAG